MSRLISIIIPCFNGAKWLQEAIDSCLNQSYLEIEIIVIDDGSTDDSLSIIKSYGSKIIWESGPNRGGNYARNRGFLISKGEYIQYLDADDYILPNKLERQVSYLEETGFDVVYGDWQHRYHLPSGHTFLSKIRISGKQTDILESFLSGWWVALASLLFRRNVVEKAGGWDESLRICQDKDFLLSVALIGAKISYQPGCSAVYRNYGNVTVSTSSKDEHLKTRQIILKRFEKKLLHKQGTIYANYKRALSQSYFMIAREYLRVNNEKLYFQNLEKALNLYPDFKANMQNRTAAYNIAQTIFGFKIVEKIVFHITKIKGAKS